MVRRERRSASSVWAVLVAIVAGTACSTKGPSAPDPPPVVALDTTARFGGTYDLTRVDGNILPIVLFNDPELPFLLTGASLRFVGDSVVWLESTGVYRSVPSDTTWTLSRDTTGVEVVVHWPTATPVADTGEVRVGVRDTLFLRTTPGVARGWLGGRSLTFLHRLP